MDWLLQSAALRMSVVVTPAFATVNTDALRTEWALNIVVSIPALSMMVFNHLAIVDDATALCGLIVAISSFSSLLSFRMLLVEARSVLTGHSLVL